MKRAIKHVLVAVMILSVIGSVAVMPAAATDTTDEQNDDDLIDTDDGNIDTDLTEIIDDVASDNEIAIHDLVNLGDLL